MAFGLKQHAEAGSAAQFTASGHVERATAQSANCEGRPRLPLGAVCKAVGGDSPLGPANEMRGHRAGDPSKLATPNQVSVALERVRLAAGSGAGPQGLWLLALGAGSDKAVLALHNQHNRSS